VKSGADLLGMLRVTVGAKALANGNVGSPRTEPDPKKSELVPVAPTSRVVSDRVKAALARARHQEREGTQSRRSGSGRSWRGDAAPAVARGRAHLSCSATSAWPCSLRSTARHRLGESFIEQRLR
jgi:hypothetical protein